MCNSIWRRLAVAATAVACALLGACSSLPQIDRDAIASEAIPLSTATTLGRIAKQSQPSPEVSGFRLMPLGLFSLDARVQLARRAGEADVADADEFAGGVAAGDGDQHAAWRCGERLGSGRPPELAKMVPKSTGQIFSVAPAAAAYASIRAAPRCVQGEFSET